MTNPDSLFHYTTDFQTLLVILKTGFRFSFSLETYALPAIKTETGNLTSFLSDPLRYGFVGIPMVCFCDIPISRANKHASEYNNYCVGISKDFVIALYGQNYREISFNPIQYISADNFYLAFQDLFILDKLRNSAPSNVQFCKKSLCNILGLYKPLEGFDFKNNRRRRFYDENEWRCIYLDKVNPKTDWLLNLPTDYKSAKLVVDKANSKLYCSKLAYLPFEEDKEHCLRYFTNHIIVNNDDEIEEVIKVIRKSPKLFGISLPLRSHLRDWLLTRVTSFERIENDY